MKKKYIIGIVLGLFIIGLMANVPNEREMKNKLDVINKNYKKESKNFPCDFVVNGYKNYLLFSTLDFEIRCKISSDFWSVQSLKLLGIGGNIFLDQKIH